MVCSELIYRLWFCITTDLSSAAGAISTERTPILFTHVADESQSGLYPLYSIIIEANELICALCEITVESKICFWVAYKTCGFAFESLAEVRTITKV